MTDPLRLGIVGCGRLTERGYLPALAGRSDELVVVAVADPDQDRAREVASQIPDDAITIHRDAVDLVAAATVDAVLVASPVHAHVADAEAIAAGGLPALVEKPPAPSAHEAARLATLAPQPQLGFNRRFDPGARRIRDAVPASGPIRLRASLSYRRASWGAVVVHDDALTDLGPHLVDWVRWTTTREVLHVASPRLTRTRAELHLELEDGGRAVVQAAVDRPHEERLELDDAAGHRLAGHRLGGLVAGVRARLRRTDGPDALVTTLRHELEAFARAVRDPSALTDLGTPADGVAVMLVIDAARASAAAGGAPVAVPTQLPR